MASHSSLYGGNSRTPGSPVRPSGGCTVARSKTVGPSIAQTPLQSGNAAGASCACTAPFVTATPIASATTRARGHRRAMLTPLHLQPETRILQVQPLEAGTAGDCGSRPAVLQLRDQWLS